MDINMKHSCRTCLAEARTNMLQVESLIDVESYSLVKLTVSEVILECTNLQIMPGDDLPQTVCIGCVNKATDAYNFKKMCQSTHEKLQNHIRKNPIKNEPNVSTYCENSVFVPEMVQLDNLAVEHFHDENVDEDNSYDNDDFMGANEGSDTNSDHDDDNDKKANEDWKPDEDNKSDNYWIPDADEQLGDDWKTDEDFRRVNNAKQVNGRYQCEMCEKTLADRQTFLLHTRLHLGKNLKHCDTCGRGFAKQNHLDRHKVTHTRSLTCSKCSQSFDTKTKLKLHKCKIENPEENENEANEDEEEVKPANLEPTKHKLDSNIADDVTLDVSIEPLKKHRNLALDDEETRLMEAAKEIDGRLQCPICPRTLSQRKILRLHIRSHVGKNLLHCVICNKGFAKGSNLNRHLLLHRNVNSDEENKIIKKSTQNNGSFKCPYCSKVLIDRQTFRLHIRLHINKKTMVYCTICNLGCENATQLQNHMTSHDDIAPKPFEKPEQDTIVEEAIEEDGENEDDEDIKIVNKSKFVDGRYVCQFCPKTLANRTTLKYHIRLHLGKNLLKCDICGQGFSKKSHLKRHMSTHIKKDHACKYCEAVFESYHDRRTHMATVHKTVVPNRENRKITPWTRPNGTKEGKCMICKTSYNRLSELRKHLNDHTSMDNDGDNVHEEIHLKMYQIVNEWGWEMTLSDSETEDEGEMSKVPEYACNKCNTSFDRIHKLMQHMDQHVNDARVEEFKCSHCTRNFPSSNVLFKHLRQQCENADKSYICSVCSSRFYWKTNLDRHLTIYHNNSESKATSHKKKNGRDSNGEKKFSCEICEKRFTRRDNLKSHMQVHMPPEKRTFQIGKHLCSYCGRRFSNSSNLTVHIRRHTGERPYQCEFCNARFPRSSDLQCHRRTHTGEKTCMCNVCGKGFTRSNKLVRHMRTHTGERPYKCPHCERAFTQSNDLKLHVRRHTGDKPFSCSCGERFITNSLLQQHRRSTNHIEISAIHVPSNSVNNPHRKFNPNDGIKTSTL